MPTSVYIVLSNSADGRDDEFNDWYDKQHLDDIVAVNGYVRARRYKISEAQYKGPQTQYKYLAIYEVEGDTQEAVDNIAAAISGGMFVSDALGAGFASTFYEPITAWVTSKKSDHDGDLPDSIAE